MSNERHAVGLRFRPTDEELVDFYLRNMVLGNDSLVQCIAKLGDICDYEPWDLPRFSMMDSEDQDWYLIFSPNYKYRKSKRVNWRTKAGYWKVTGNSRNVTSRNDPENVIGMKRTLVFYEKSDPDGKDKRTSWVIHEYKLTANLPNQNSFLLVKLKKKDEEEKPDDSSAECESNSLIFETDLEVLDETGLGQGRSGTYQEQEVHSNSHYPPIQEEHTNSPWNFLDSGHSGYDMTQGEEAEFCNSFLADGYEAFPEDE